MVIQINLSNKTAYLLLLIVSLGLIAVVGVGVYAYGSGPYPSVMGHSYGELGIPTSCSEGQTLKWSGGNLVCGSDAVGAPSCNFDGWWGYWDSGSGNDFGVVCRNGVVIAWCSYPAGAGIGNVPGQYNC